MHDCVTMHSSNTILQFVDDTTILGLIIKGEETANRDELRVLSITSVSMSVKLKR